MTNYLNVSGAQVTEQERKFIKLMAEQAASSFGERCTLVNIGIMWGCTLWCLREGASNAMLYGVDIAPDNWKITDLEDLRAKIIQGDSTEVHADFDPPIHLLLIDGNHHYNVVKLDIAGWVHKVPQNGIVIFHDYNPSKHNLQQFPELAGVKKAVDEWFKDTNGWRWLQSVDSLAVFRFDGVE